MDFQPCQQGFFRQNVLVTHLQGIEGIQKIVEIGGEGAALVLGPLVLQRLAQSGQQLGVVAGAAELHHIKLGILVKFQKLVVSLDAGILAALGQNTLDCAGDPGRAKIAQHGNTLVALFHIEITQIFVAGNGVADTLFKVGKAQVGPFQSELTVGLCQRQERGGKGGDAAGGAGADDPFGGDFHKTDILHHVGSVVVQQIVQNSGVGRLAGGDHFFIFFLTLAQCRGVFFFCFQKIHIHPP